MGRLEYSGLFRWAQNIHRNLYKEKKRAEKLVRRFGDAVLLDLKMGEGLWANECREPLRAKEGKKKSPS